ncbi:MAG: hypothetical protein II848_00470 [Candidatus Methanomethylophilus sp.]|nr:hypothetical protein [Methanomethylophilus sp.]
MSKVLFAWISAFLMVAVGCAVLVDAADDSAATCPSSCHCLDPADVTVTGSVNVYYYVNNQWDAVNVPAYDLKQAVDAASNTLGYSLTYATGANVWTDGSNPTVNYGEIATVNSSATFTIFVYDNTSSQWIEAQTAIGWYRPFADYAATEFPDGSSAGAANIAIVPAAVSAIPAGTATELAMVGLTQITQTAEYRYCFHLQANITVPIGVMVTVYDEDEGFTTVELNNTMLTNGIVIYGYGSDGYQALKNALPGQVVGQEVTFELHTNPNNTTYYTFYSWMDTVLGAGTISEFGDNYSKYTYWASYTCGHVTGGTDWLSYTFGYYSKLVGNYNPACGFTYLYEVSLYTW